MIYYLFLSGLFFLSSFCFWFELAVSLSRSFSTFSSEKCVIKNDRANNSNRKSYPECFPLFVPIKSSEKWKTRNEWYIYFLYLYLLCSLSQLPFQSRFSSLSWEKRVFYAVMSINEKKLKFRTINRDNCIILN